MTDDTKERYELELRERFGTVEDDTSSWIIRGISDIFVANLIVLVAELAGRLPLAEDPRIGLADDGEPVTIASDARFIWDACGEAEDALFEADEMSISLGEKPTDMNVIYKPKRELDDEHAELVRYATLSILKSDTRWMNPGQTYANRMAAPASEVAADIEELTGGRRTLDLADLPDVELAYSGAPSILGQYQKAVTAIARSGAVGDEAREMVALIEEIEGVVKIFERFADAEELKEARREHRIGQLRERAGIDGFVGEYLDGSVPLDDILA